jgi:hypothetical protein
MERLALSSDILYWKSEEPECGGGCYPTCPDRSVRTQASGQSWAERRTWYSEYSGPESCHAAPRAIYGYNYVLKSVLKAVVSVKTMTTVPAATFFVLLKLAAGGSEGWTY